MATKKYIFTADTKQMVNQLSSVSKILNNISEQPDKFQKSVYTAFSKAQRDIHAADGDITKIGKSLNVLTQTINKGLDFSNMKEAAKGIVEMFNDVSNKATIAKDKVKQLNNEVKSVNLKSVYLGADFNKFIEGASRASVSANSLKDTMLTTSSASNRLATSALNVAQKTNGLDANFNSLNEITSSLSQRINNVSETISNLSTKARDAKGNISVLKVTGKELSDVFAKIKDLELNIKNIDLYQNKIADLRKGFLAISREYANNKKVISDLRTEYDTSKASLDALTARYENLKKQMASIKASGGVIPDDLINKMKELKIQVTNASASLKEQSNTINSLISNQNKLKTTSRLLYDEYNRLQKSKGIYGQQLNDLKNNVAELKNKATATEQAARSSEQLNTSMMKQSSTLRLVGGQFRSLIYDLNAVRIAFIILSSATGIGATIKVIGEFDRSMARVRSLMLGAEEATASLNVKYKAITDTVMALGASTKFTAGEVAEGAVIITQAGYSANQTIAALKPTLDLAVAGQIEMKEAADTLTKTIAMFGKTAEDAANIADIYAAAVNYSQTNMTELATAMTYVGPVAQSLGYSLEETAGYLAILANNGITASKAGTSLRQMFMNLKNPTSDASKIINAYGVNLKELEKQGYTTEQAVRKALVTLGANDQLSKVIRVTALPSAEILAKSNEQLEKMVGNLKNIDGYAKKVAENNMDNLLDQFIQFSSAVQDTMIRFGQFTGLTDGLTSALKSSADAIRSWNTDMPELIKNVLAFGASLLVLRGRIDAYKTSMKNASVDANVSMISSTNKVKASMLSTISSMVSVGKVTDLVKTKLLNLSKSLLAFGRAALVVSLQTAAVSAVIYGLFTVIEKFISTGRSMEDVLNRHQDLFNAAKENATSYKEALDAVSASAKNMSQATLTSKIEQTEQDIETVKEDIQKNLDGMIYGIKVGISQLDAKLLNNMISEEEYEVVVENLEKSLDLFEAIKNNQSDEEIAQIVAEIDPNALKQIQDKYKIDLSKNNYGLFSTGKSIIPVIEELAGSSDKLKRLKDYLNSLNTEKSQREVKKLKSDISDLIKDLTNASKINAVNVDTKLFTDSLNEADKEIAKLDKLITMSDFQNIFNKIIDKPTGKDFAELIDFSREKGGFYFIKDINAELDILRQRLVALKSLDKVSVISNVSSLFSDLPIIGKKFNIKGSILDMEELIKKMQGLSLEIENANEKANQLNFLKVMNDTAKMIDTYKIEQKVKDLFKGSDLSETFKDSFISGIKPDFLYEGFKLDVLKPGSIILDTDIENIRIAGQAIDDYVVSLQNMANAQYKAGQMNEQKFKNLMLYSSQLKDAFAAALDKSSGKKGRKRDDDLELMFYKSKVAIGEATNGLYAQWEALVKVREIERQILDIKERNKDSTSQYYDKLLKSLEVQKEIARVQFDAKVPYDSMQKNLDDNKRIYSATGLDGDVLGVGNQYINVLTQRKALEDAIANSSLKNNQEVIQALKDELLLNETLLKMQENMAISKNAIALADKQQQYIDLTSASWFAERDKQLARENALKFQSLIYSQQLSSVEQSIYEYRKMMESDEKNKAYYESQVQLLEIKKEQLKYEQMIAEMQVKTQDPTGWQGFSNGVREYAQSISNYSTMVKDAMTSMFDTIESGLTEGLYAAMKKTEYDWSQFWDNMARIFLQKAIQMTIMKAMTNVIDVLGVLFTGGAGGGDTFLGGLLKGSFGGGSSMSMPKSNTLLSPTSRHASGGIVKKPTYMLGKDGWHQAGEAGAEAILPVQRMSNGKYGVSVENSGKPVVNNNDFSVHITTTGSSGDKQKDEEYINTMSSQLKKMMTNQINEYFNKQFRQGGTLYKVGAK